MLPRAGRSFSGIRAFILAPPICTADIPFGVAPLAPTRGPAPSHCSKCLHQRWSLANFSTTITQPKSVPYALTAAAHAFEKQVQRGELHFLPQAYDHLRQVVLEAQRRGIPLTDTGAPILPEETVKRARSLLATSPQREHVALHLAIFNDAVPILHLHAEMIHPLELTAQLFQEHAHDGTLDTLPHIYDHLHSLADVIPDPRRVFATEPSTWRAVSWMRRLMGGKATNLVPRILHDLPRLFGLQPTLVHHQMVIKGFLSRDLPEEAWAWLRKMEQHEDTEHSTVWLKPSIDQYNLLLKYFADRGDVFSVRVLLAQMRTHVAPSRLSHHLLLTAILAKPAAAHDRRALVEAAIEQLESEGHGVHLKMLGGIMGRPLKSCVTPEVFDVLRAAQTRDNVRASGIKRLREQDLGGPDRPQPQKTDGREGDESAQSDTVVSETQTRKQPETLCDATTVYTGEGTPVDYCETPSDARPVHIEEHANDSDPHSRVEHTDAMPFQNGNPSVDLVTASPETSANVSFVDGDGTSINAPRASSSVPPRDNSLSERLRQREIARSVQHGTYIHPDTASRSQLRHGDRVDDEGLGALDRVNPGEKVAGTVSGSTTNFLHPTSRSNAQYMRLPRVSETDNESQTRLSSEEPDAAKSTINPARGRVRRKYGDLLSEALRNGDLRHASKVYAELAAAVGPDVEFGGAMIGALCRKHLRKPPPRPHIMQALKIYQSLVEVEKRVGTGFFDSATCTSHGHTKIGINIYKDLLRALSFPAPVDASSRDYGTKVYNEYTSFATDLLYDMEARGFKPDNKILVSILLLRFRSAKTHQEAFDHYKSILANDTHSFETTDDDSWNRTAFKAILSAFTKMSFSDAPVSPAHLWFSMTDEMRIKGYPVTVEDYTRYLSRITDVQTTPSLPRQALISGALENGEEGRIMSMYAYVRHVHKRLVLDAHISPDAHLLNTLMNVYQHLGAFEDALRVFNSIWLSCRMDHVTPVIIFDACGHAGQQRIAHMIWCMLVAKGWRFDKRTLDTWVECLCRTDVEAACRFVCVYMGREHAGYISDGDTRPDVQTCLILLKLSWRWGQNADVKERIKAHLPHIWEELASRYQ